MNQEFFSKLLFGYYVTAIPKYYFTTEAFLRFGRSNIYRVRSFTQLVGSFFLKRVALSALVVKSFFPFFLFTQQQELHSGRFLHATFTPQSQLKGVFCPSLREGFERPFAVIYYIYYILHMRPIDNFFIKSCLPQMWYLMLQCYWVFLSVLSKFCNHPVIALFQRFLWFKTKNPG